uniref:Uncharacterized protein n=1 Tax=uncultured marine virus TaxID=186617 RepID=A0A0F7L8X1_9VIRU|nr:hypothetical protein [uncultured marine virus]
MYEPLKGEMVRVSHIHQNAPMSANRWKWPSHRMMARPPRAKRALSASTSASDFRSPSGLFSASR